MGLTLDGERWGLDVHEVRLHCTRCHHSTTLHLSRGSRHTCRCGLTYEVRTLRRDEDPFSLGLTLQVVASTDRAEAVRES